MRIIESTIIFPIAIFVICFLILVTLSMFSKLQYELIEKHENVISIYEESEENIIREWDKLHGVI